MEVLEKRKVGAVEVGSGDFFDESLLELLEPGVVIASYYVQDHLGNTRVVYEPVFCGNQTNGEPIEYAVEYVGDYFPYGKTIREYVSGKKEKFLTTHHERDQETGLDYRGARFYDADIGRFLSLDPLAMDYPSLSDYSYVAGNPVAFVDPDGRHIVPSGVKTPKWIANDLNKIYEREYGVGDAFKVVTKEVKIVKANPDYGWDDYLNPFSETPETITKMETRTVIEASEDFDWNKDKYTRAIKDIIDSDEVIELEVIEDEDRPLYKGLGGGETINENKVELSSKLYKTTNNSYYDKRHWTIGSATLHELIYHIYPNSLSDQRQPNNMRKQYNQKQAHGMSENHDQGGKQNKKIKTNQDKVE